MFRDRVEAGRLLAEHLLKYKHRKDAIILAIPRGGIIVGRELSRRLGLPLDVVVIKKIGYPGNEEFAIGAAGPDDHYLNGEVTRDIDPDYVREQVRAKQREARARYRMLRGKRPAEPLKGRTVILVDDGIATGATVIMGIQMIRKQSPQAIVVAVPVAPPDTVTRLKGAADEVVAVEQPDDFMAIGQFYRDFTQVSDEEAVRALEEANR